MVRRMGAYTQLWGATIVSPEEINGEVHIGFSDRVQVLILWQFLVPWGKIGSADERASNRELEDEVIAYIREQIKDFLVSVEDSSPFSIDKRYSVEAEL